jgi:hypothetical protein
VIIAAKLDAINLVKYIKEKKATKYKEIGVTSIWLVASSAYVERFIVVSNCG